MSMARLRQINAVLGVLMLGLFVLHGVGNSFELVGAGLPTSKQLARAVATLAIVHGVIGVILTVHTLRAQRDKGVAYVWRNARFWAVRASGLAIAVFVALHMATFLQVGGAGAYRLREFGTLQLVSNLGLVASMAVHVVCNARPLAVALGMAAPRSRAADVALVFSLLLLLMGAAFVVYFLRWSVV